MNMHKRTIQNIVYGEALPEKSLVADGNQMILCRYVVPSWNLGDPLRKEQDAPADK